MNKKELNEIKFYTTIAIIILILFNFFISLKTLTELVPRIEAAEYQNAVLVEALKKSDEYIKTLTEKRNDNEKILTAFREMYWCDFQKQQEWNKSRSNTSNENLHLLVEEIVIKYIENDDVND